MFSGEFCGISKNTFFHRTPPAAASETASFTAKLHNLPLACNIFKKETLAQVLSCEFCETSKNTFITEHLWATASTVSQGKLHRSIMKVQKIISFRIISKINANRNQKTISFRIISKRQ